MDPVRVTAWPVRAVMAVLLTAFLAGCTDTGAAPADRDTEVRELEAVLDQVTDSLTEEHLTFAWQETHGAGCGLRDCVLLQRTYQVAGQAPERPTDDCRWLRDGLTASGMTQTSQHDVTDGCEVGGWVDGVVVSATHVQPERVTIAAHYPKG